jgi:SET domain-containing protein
MRRIVVRQSAIHGRGVFAVRPIAAGERILEYKGKVTDWQQALRRYRRSSTPDGHTFLFGLSDGRVIDGGSGGNSARWFNHACSPNCTTIEDNGRVYIEAATDIDIGDELFIDYQLDVDGRRTAAVRLQYACRCQSSQCRGTMLAAR